MQSGGNWGNWNEWESVKQARLWEAVALALDVDPRNFYFFGDRKLDTIFNGSQPPRFAKILELALGNIYAGGVLKPPSIDLAEPHESEIKVFNFVKWAKSINLELPPGFPGTSTRSAEAKYKKPSHENDRSTLLGLIATLAEEVRLDMAPPSKAASVIEDLTIRISARISARVIENHLKRDGTAVDAPLQITRKNNSVEPNCKTSDGNRPHQDGRPKPRGQYGEPLGWQIKGVEHENLFIPTRLQQWRIERRPLGNTPLERIPYADFENSGMPEPCSPWTCVNNCTGSLDEEWAYSEKPANDSSAKPTRQYNRNP